MIKTAFLSSYIWLIPTLNSSGNVGIKFTEKISQTVYFKIRVEDFQNIQEKPDPKIRIYFDFDF